MSPIIPARNRFWFLGLAAALLLTSLGCASSGSKTSSDEGVLGDQPVAAQADALSFLRRRRRPPTTAGTTGSTTAGTTASTTAGTGSQQTPGLPPGAQNPDGSAIPQGVLPNGECTAVVAQFGFWSCLNIGDQCTYQSGGVTHHCLCQRVDGEGQYPAFTCD